MSRKQINIEHFQNIVAVAFADGILADEEAAFLERRAEDYELDMGVVKRIMDDAENLKFVIPMNEEDREEQLSDAVYMAMIDGQVHETEYNLCLKIAEKLDLTSNYLDQVIELTRKLSS